MNTTPIIDTLHNHAIEDTSLNALNSLLQQIKPDLTVYGVLLAFSIISFLIAKFFWNFEYRFRDENLDRIKSIMLNYRSRHIEPIISEQLNQNFKMGVITTVSRLESTIFEENITTPNTIEKQLIDSDRLKEVLNPLELKSWVENIQLENIYEEYLRSSTGEDLFEKLDNSYERKNSLIIGYKKARNAIRFATYSFLGLFILMIFGILNIFINANDYIELFWIFLSVIILLIGIISYIVEEYYRSKIIYYWEKIEIYGQVE